MPKAYIFPRYPRGGLYFALAGLGAILSFAVALGGGAVFSPDPLVRLLALVALLSPWVAMTVFARLGLAAFSASLGALLTLGAPLSAQPLEPTLVAIAAPFYAAVPLLLRSYLRYVRYTGMVLDPPVYWYYPRLVYARA